MPINQYGNQTKVSREVIISIRTSCLTSPESIQLMNRRIEDNIGRCENLIERGNKDINHMIVSNLEQNNEPIKRKKLKI